jgi:protein phosphatase
MHLVCAARTDTGIVRSVNEDSYLMLPDSGVFIVADGVGGRVAGAVASEMAVQIIAAEIRSPDGLLDTEVGDRMRLGIRTANDAIFERAISEHDKRGMGTTATVLVLRPGGYLIAQVGDSRAYRLRNNRLSQLTTDHTYVQELVDAGLLTLGQARVHPWKHVISRAVGTSEDVVPDIYRGLLEHGDTFLVASDGVTGMLDDEDLAGILSSDGGPQDGVDRVIAEANRRGGLDDMTAIVVRIEAVDSPDGEAPTALAAAAKAGCSGRLLSEL